MLEVLGILHTIHDLSERIENGEEFHFHKTFGPVNLTVAGVLADKVDEATTVVISHTDSRKISKTIIGALLAALTGNPITEGLAVVLGQEKGIDKHLVVTFTATIKDAGTVPTTV